MQVDKAVLLSREVCWDEVLGKPFLRRLTQSSPREREGSGTRGCVSGISGDVQSTGSHLERELRRRRALRNALTGSLTLTFFCGPLVAGTGVLGGQ